MIHARATSDKHYRRDIEHPWSQHRVSDTGHKQDDRRYKTMGCELWRKKWEVLPTLNWWKTNQASLHRQDLHLHVPDRLRCHSERRRWAKRSSLHVSLCTDVRRTMYLGVRESWIGIDVHVIVIRRMDGRLQCHSSMKWFGNDVAFTDLNIHINIDSPISICKLYLHNRSC